MTRKHFQMNRRQFLKISGAFTSIEFDETALADNDTDHPSDEPRVSLSALAQRLPSPDRLNTESHLAFSLTRLDEDVATPTAPALSGADSYATVFAGRTATDVAFGLDDSRTVRDQITGGGYETLGTRDDWPLFHRRTRTRHRVIAITDSAAVIGVGPVLDETHNDVTETLSALSDHSAPRMTDEKTPQTVLERLGSGIHLSVDLTPDSRRHPAAVEATGERYEIAGDAPTIRTVTLYDTPAHARTASLTDHDSPTVLQRPDATDCSTDCHGHAVVRDATIPRTAFPSRH